MEHNLLVDKVGSTPTLFPFCFLEMDRMDTELTQKGQGMDMEWIRNGCEKDREWTGNRQGMNREWTQNGHGMAIERQQKACQNNFLAFKESRK